MNFMRFGFNLFLGVILLTGTFMVIVDLISLYDYLILDMLIIISSTLVNPNDFK